jgi:amino acid transporter
MPADAPPLVPLRRDLRSWQVTGLSVGLMAPSMAISINPQGAVGAVGRAIPLSFAIALVGALLVAYGFARLAGHFESSGSVLGLVGATLGARAGVVAAWCLAGTYLLFTVLTGITAGIFGSLLVQIFTGSGSEPRWLAYLLAALILASAGALTTVPTSRATRLIVSVEGLTITLIVVATAVVLVDLLGRRGPGHLGYTWSVFVPAAGTSTSAVFLGVVFGFLSFGGFEGAASLGEEARRPRRDIPRALFATVGGIGAFYVVVSAVEVMGFGTSPAGLARFSASPALLGTLGRSYVAGWFGDAIIVGTVVSAFGCAMSSVVGASRILASFARQGLGPGHPLARVSPGSRAPRAATALVAAAALALVGAFGLAGTAPLELFAWSGTVSTLLLMVAYGLVAAGAGLWLFVRPRLAGLAWRAHPAEAVIPVAALVVLGYTLWRNLMPYPKGADAWLPAAAAAWLLAALVYVAAAPGPSRRLGRRLVVASGVERRRS